MDMGIIPILQVVNTKIYFELTVATDTLSGWVPCHCGMVHHQVANGGDSLLIKIH